MVARQDTSATLIPDPQDGAPAAERGETDEKRNCDHPGQGPHLDAAWHGLRDSASQPQDLVPE